MCIKCAVFNDENAVEFLDATDKAVAELKRADSA